MLEESFLLCKFFYLAHLLAGLSLKLGQVTVFRYEVLNLTVTDDSALLSIH